MYDRKQKTMYRKTLVKRGKYWKELRPVWNKLYGLFGISYDRKQEIRYMKTLVKRAEILKGTAACSE